MNERIIELEHITPKDFWGPQDLHLETIKRLYPKLKIVARGTTVKIYGESTELKFDANLRKRASDLDDEVKFCNDNHYRINDAVKLIKDGIPPDDIDLEIELLEKRLEWLKQKKGSKKLLALLFLLIHLSKKEKY